ncbi:MAG TPA: NADP-dependent malic enzyme, partial [Anaerolineae bacterium]|nr:NADP-dependent malic enzyme [Anaerolineae bacterium]
ASKPVMEGKGVLFKRFADVDVFDIEVDSTDPEEIINVVRAIAPTFGGINLEDIKAPECFEIEERLKGMLDIPVFHDDQHGTAIIATAGLMNALEISGKDIGEIKIVVNGAGAAAIACAEMFILAGAKRENITMLDSRGVIHTGRESKLNKYKKRFMKETDARTLEDAMRGADVFMGLSVADVLTPEMVKSMGDHPVIFAMANPDPEIRYEVAKEARPDAIVATGRSDYPNQVNNVLGFPFIFRGALDVHARQINDEMKLAASRALAALAHEDVPDSVLRAYNLQSLKFGPDYIIPKPFDPRVLLWVAPAVAEAAIKTGVARTPLDMTTYREQLEARLGKGWALMRTIVNKAKSDPKRIVFGEGDAPKIIRAAALVEEEGIGKPILLGNPQTVKQCIQELGLNFNPTVVNPAEDAHFDEYVQQLVTDRHRKGVTEARARRLMLERRYFGPMMVKKGQGDAFISGLHQDYPEVIRPALEVVGTADGVRKVAGMYILIVREKVYFVADTTVNIDPTAEDLAEIAILTADAVRQFNFTPRIAMLSFSNFGSTRHPFTEKVQKAVALVREKRPDLVVDGEMMADTAVTPEIIDDLYPFSRVRDANVLIFPNLESANIAYKLVQRLGKGELIGPILLGMSKPVHVLQRGDEVREIFNMAAVAAVDAHQ